MKRKLLLCALFLVCCLSVSVTATAGKVHSAVTSTSKEDSLVLKSALKQIFSRSNSKDYKYVVHLDTIALKGSSELMYPHAEHDKDYYKDFVRRNATSHTLTLAPFEHFLVVDEKHRKNEKYDIDKWWKEFYRSFPHAASCVYLSLPGYSKDHTQALVSVDRASGSLAGEGTLLLLKKKKGRWHLVAAATQWVS